MRKGATHWHSDQPHNIRSDRYALANTREVVEYDLTQELHDTVIQPLTSLLISFTLAECKSGRDDIEANLNMWKGLAQEALDSLRSSLANVRTPPLRTEDLPTALRCTLIPQFGAHGLRLRLECYDWPADLPPEWNTQLYLVVREAVTNAQKHARASEVNILLRADADGLWITVSDNGVGFAQRDTAETQELRPGCGLGINSMRDRVRLLGGEMSVSSAPGRGVRIVIQLSHSRTAKRPAHSKRESAKVEHATAEYIH